MYSFWGLWGCRELATWISSNAIAFSPCYMQCKWVHGTLAESPQKLKTFLTFLDKNTFMSKSQTLDHKDIAQKQPFPKLMFDMGYFVKFRLHIKIIFQCKKGSSFFIKCYLKNLAWLTVLKPIGMSTHIMKITCFTIVFD